MTDHSLRVSGRRVSERRWVDAPPGGDPSAVNRIIGVWLSPGERVSWEWDTAPHGRPYVCGYTIERSRRAAPQPMRRCGFRLDA
jgi:hypothetical protein